MYVTNLLNVKLGINGLINLAPKEVNRYIDNEDLDLVARVVRLEAANLVSVVREEGLTKTGITGKIVKTMGADTSALTQAPRTGGGKPPVAPAPLVQKEEEEIKPPAAEVAPEDPKDEDLKDEDLIPMFSSYYGDETNLTTKILLDNKSISSPVHFFSVVGKEDKWTYNVQITVKNNLKFNNIMWHGVPNTKKLYNFFNTLGFEINNKNSKIVEWRRNKTIIQYFKTPKHFYEPFLLIKQVKGKKDIHLRNELGEDIDNVLNGKVKVKLTFKEKLKRFIDKIFNTF